MDDAAQMACLARAVTSVGSAAFPPALTALFQSVFRFDSLFISLFAAKGAPRPLYSNPDDDATRRTIAPYLNAACLLDPFHGLFKAQVGTCVVALDSCAPDDFRHSDYVHMFYSDTGLRDEVTIFVAAGSDASIVLSLGQRDGRHNRPPDTCPRLTALLPVIAALCLKHWPDPARLPTAAMTASPDFERMGLPKLSLREAEVVRMMLRGHSSKSMARLFGISPETVKVHRKRIYSKLGLTSQGALFSLFVDTLALPPLPPLPHLTADHSAQPQPLHS